MWYQLVIANCPGDAVESLSDQLEVLGALSLMFTDKNDDPVLEPEPGMTPLWPEVVIHALFCQATDAEQARVQVLSSQPELHCTLEILPDKDWERVWMDDFKPQRFGKRLWICPTTSTPPDPDAINLMLDPGLAFGTGSHPTTSLCLTWLEQASLNHKTLIDYGCGSGILSLAALKLGAEQVFAVDIDNQALQATQNNALTNSIQSETLTISLPDVLQRPADVIIANILLAPLISLKTRFNELLLDGGLLVVSGLLEEQAAQLVTAYDPTFTLLNQQTLEGWALLVFHKGLDTTFAISLGTTFMDKTA